MSQPSSSGSHKIRYFADAFLHVKIPAVHNVNTFVIQLTEDYESGGYHNFASYRLFLKQPLNEQQTKYSQLQGIFSKKIVVLELLDNILKDEDGTTRILDEFGKEKELEGIASDRKVRGTSK